MKLLWVLGFVVIAWLVAAGAAEAVSRLHPPRGKMIDIGGRKLRLVCQGEGGNNPTIWMEAGAFSGAADFAAIQLKLARKGLRSCAYDRAGMGYSDPGPHPRDASAISADLEKLIAASGERGPFTLMAHSMGGIYVRDFAARHPGRVAGLVLIEGMTPELIDAPGIDVFVKTFLTLGRVNAVAGTIGLTKPAYFFKDRIGLPPEGRREKQRGAANGGQARTALNEIEHWRDAADQAKAAGRYDPAWPVAVVTAGRIGGNGIWATARRAPAEQSRSGTFENVPGASHTTILGPAYNDVIVRAVLRIAAEVSSAAPAR